MKASGGHGRAVYGMQKKQGRSYFQPGSGLQGFRNQAIALCQPELCICGLDRLTAIALKPTYSPASASWGVK